MVRKVNPTLVITDDDGKGLRRVNAAEELQ